MREPRSTLVIFRNRKFCGEVGSLSGMSNQMETGGMEFATSKAVPEMRRNPGSDCGSLRVSRWNLRPLGWSGAGNPAHALKVT